MSDTPMSPNEPHLFDAGWTPDAESHKKFEARHPATTAGEDARKLRQSLEKAGYLDPRQRKEIMQSSRDPSLKTAEGQPNWGRERVPEGTKFYALTTVIDDGRGYKSSSSAYWLSEAQIKRFEQDGFVDTHNRKIEAAELKNRLAIPCSNRVNGLVEAKVTREHEAVKTTVGRGKDIYSVGNEERTRWMDGGEEQWHPDLKALDLDRTINRQKLAERDGRVADYRSFDIRYSPADRQNQQATGALGQQRRSFGGEVEACDKALVESRRRQDYDPAARADYAKRKAEMDGLVSAAAKDPALLDEIRDDKVRKSMQERVTQWQRQSEPGARRQGQQPEAQ